MMGFGMGFGLLGLLMMLLFWGGLILLAVLLVRALFRGDHGSFNTPTGHAETAREILDQRYARGELTREQYELMKKDLS
ncbi:MAG TPA: SHOCT domain-containing protein [Anaerolineales bacterium]|nr:SHOCT domain-containing protein [Anaerolineales bacterium]